MEYWREELYHYAKGETARNHKYIRKEGNRYIYADDNKGSTKNKSGIGNWLSGAANSVGNWVSNAANSVGDFVTNVGYDVDEALGGNARRVQYLRDKLKEAQDKQEKLREDLDTANNEWLEAYQKWQSQYKELVDSLKFPKAILDDPSKATVIDPTKPALAPENTKKLHEYIASGKSLRFLAEFTYADKNKLSSIESMLKKEYEIGQNRDLIKAKYSIAEGNVKYYEEQLKNALSHSDTNSPSISHGCLGGTAIIHRF